ncbi:replication protein A 70 kDa DNA-binding subunit D-like isoform X2 [Chenopodium quinoa]|uniref:replication protein A 70 kDa DNA-binding subunit D-like isoform X2 n=1 Tax=Chenopodium quinoa TaxID=63459 RepID=UPI000B78947E|nr:replication protein A 70 kDa DNA-binding subunit D-like isoform X2 [Chenopodium quinoa]
MGQKYKAARQKPEYMYLNQLNAASKSYIVRVVVAEKGRDTLSSKKTVRFQTLLLKDEKDELLWIEVTIQYAELEKVKAYTGCSNCWKRTNLPLHKRYSCSSCSKKECISTKRITFKFEASDDTGTMAFTTFNDDTERLFRCSAAEIYAIKEADNHDAFKVIQDMLSSMPFYIKVGLTLHLGQNYILEGTLKSIEPKEDPNTREALQPFDSSSNQGKDGNEKDAQQTVGLGNPEPVIPTPNIKTSSQMQTQEDPCTETLELPQQDVESFKRKKTLEKSPTELGDKENESEQPL